MAAVDYEAAWVELLDLVASRDGWGSKTLITEAAQIAARHRVSDALVERVARIFGGDGIAAVFTHPGQAPSAGGSTLTDQRGVAPPNAALGEHDGEHAEHDR